MNGGADSSVAAWNLKRDAHEVVGVTLRFHDFASDDEQRAAAVRTCFKLGIEHHVVNAYDLFRDAIETPFIEACLKGNAPDMEPICAAHALFEGLYQLMERYNCDQIATGHFARITRSSDGVDLKPLQLRSALDKHADQSYLLYGVSADILSKTVFPLGETFKTDVHKNVMRAGLATCSPVDAGVGLCYPEEGTYAAWLQSQGMLEIEPGNIVALSSGEQLGTHEGLCHYEIGQELELKACAAPQCVVAKDASSNTLFVGPASAAKREECVLRNVNWTSVLPFAEKRSCRIKFSEDAPLRPCQAVVQADGSVLVSFNQPCEGVLPGHHGVLYSDALVLAGGIIQ